MIQWNVIQKIHVDTEKIMKSGKNWQGLQFHSKQSGKLSLYIIIKFRLYNHSGYGKTEKYIFFSAIFDVTWHISSRTLRFLVN